MIDPRQSERSIEHDAPRWRLLYELQQQGCQHPWRLTDEEDDGHDEQRARQAPVVSLTFVRCEVTL